MSVPGFGNTEEVQVIVQDEIVKDDCFTVEGASVLESKLEDVLLRFVTCGSRGDNVDEVMGVTVVASVLEGERSSGDDRLDVKRSCSGRW